MALKGKEVATKAPAGKRKNDTSGKSGGRKRRNPGVLQFFDVSAADAREEDDDSDENEADQDFLDEVTADLKNKNGHVKAFELPILPKEEELSGDELERYLEEKYKTGSHHAVYDGDECETKGSCGNSLMPSLKDPTIWRIKCMVGRERQIVFSLIQKYVDLHSLGTKLKIVSAFTIEHMKGYIYVEAEKQSDVLEACKGLCNIYFSRISPISSSEVSHLFSVRNTTREVSMGTWARVKYGKYKGDLAQVVAVDDTRKSAVVKLIPRINLQSLSKKLAGGGTLKESTIPAPRLISSSELEELRPHIKVKTERLTGKVFETIDGLMLKDGLLYKKVSMESLRYSGVLPSAEEIQKFETSKKDESEEMEWLSQLFGEKQKKRPSVKGMGKGEGTSGTKKGSADFGKGMTKGLEDRTGGKKGSCFQLHDLVFFGQNDFGVLIGMENDNFQILKGDLEGAEVVNVDHHEIKSGSLDKKFTTSDKNSLKLSLNDTVRVSDGILEGKQGVVKHIYKETIFVYDENQSENGGYFCVKSQLCEKISHSTDTQCGNDDEPCIPNFGDSMTSPNASELPSKKRWAKDDFNSSRRGDQDGTFSIGQTLRIKVGPLKGHICRVIAIYRSDVTVKLDSQMKVITVKCEHLSEVGVKSIRCRESDFAGTFDGFGTQGPSGDPLDVSGASTNNSGWNSASVATRRNAWPNFSSSEFLLDSTLENPFSSLISSNDQEKGEDKGDNPWGSKATIGGDKGDDPWGNKATSKKVPGAWGKSTDAGGDKGDDPWGIKTTPKKVTDVWGKSTETGGDKGDDPWGSKTISKKVTDGWGKALDTVGDQRSSWSTLTSEDKTVDNKQDQVDGWGTNQWGLGKTPSGDQIGCSKDAGGSWATGKLKIGNFADLSNNAGSTSDKTDNNNQLMSWDKGKGVVGGDVAGNCGKPVQEDSWSKAAGRQIAKDVSSDAWGKVTVKSIEENSWGKAIDSSKVKDVSIETKQDCWNQPAAARGNETWDKSVGSWNQPESGQSDRESGWNKTEIKGSSSGNWAKAEDFADGGAKGWKKDGDSWSKPRAFGSDGSSTWSKGTAAAAGDGWSKLKSDSTNGGAMSWKNDGDSWSKSNAFGSDGASSWSKTTASACGDSWNKLKGDGGSQEHGWSKNSMDNRESYGNDHSGSGDRPRTFDGGRGSGGRRGRGGYRGGNRGGRSFGRGQSSGWSGSSSGNSSSGWNDGQSEGGSRGKCFAGDQQPNWDGAASQDAGGNGNQDDWKPKSADGEKGNKNDNWNSRNSSNSGESAGWRAGGGTSVGWKSAHIESGGNQLSGWDSKASNSKGDHHSSGWDGKASLPNSSEGNQSSGWDNKTGNWSNPKSNQSSGWGGGTVANDVTNTSNEGQVGGWNSNWSSQKDSSGTQSSAWGKKLAGNEEVNGFKGQADSWSAVSQSGGNGKGGGGSWGGGSSGWGTRANDAGTEGQEPWSRKSFDNNSNVGWNKGFSDNNNDDCQAGLQNEKRDFGGRGANRGGGFHGRGRGGDFGNRGRGRRGGGRSGGWNREKGYGGNGDGGTEGASSGNLVRSWSQGGASKGWQNESSDSKEGWNQWGASKGQWQKESGGDGNQSSGWNSQGSGWNKVTTGAEESGGLKSDAGSRKEADSENWSQGGASKGWQNENSDKKEGWNQRGASNGQWQKESGGDGNQSSGWNSQGSDWNKATTGAKKSGGWNSEAGSRKEADGGTNNWSSGQVSGWSKGGDSTNEAEPKDQGSNWNRSQSHASWNNKGASGGGWNKEAASSSSVRDDSWNQPSAPAAAPQSSSGWNKTIDSKEGCPNDPWSKASGGSLGQAGNASKGGW